MRGGGSIENIVAKGSCLGLFIKQSVERERKEERNLSIILMRW